jgi:putative membrane protein
MFVLIYLHTIGGHYTFANVPFGFVTDLFWFERNHFDRIAHFSVGFYAYPLAEILVRHYKVQHNFIIYFFPLCFIAAVAGIYEVIEWIYADLSAPEAGLAFLWSQWDIWDAQKDILADTLGAIFSLSIFALFNKKDKQ